MQIKSANWILHDLSAVPPNSLSHSRNLISYPNGSQWFPSFYCIFRIHPGNCSQPPMTPVFFLGRLLPHGKEATSSFMRVQVGAGMPGCLDLVTLPSGTPNGQPNINHHQLHQFYHRKLPMTGCSTATLSWEFWPPGTGKTLAYLIPAIEHVIKNPPPGIGVLIIAPSSLWAMSRDMSEHGTGCTSEWHSVWMELY